MRRLVATVSLAVGIAAFWAVLVFIGTLEGWWHRNLAPAGDVQAFMDAAVQEIDATYKGNVAFVLIENSKVAGQHQVSIGEPVDGDTLFQVASLGKWVAALGVMVLVERGDVDLDAPVSRYLTRWELPPSDFDNNGVTVRRLLSHTAGLTDGLGYAGYPLLSDVVSLEASLSNPNPSPDNEGRIRVGTEPGSKWQYSGGGYTILQLLIEEVSGRTFNDYMRETIFTPLGMDRSTYIVDLEETLNLATLYDVDGAPATHYRFAALAAASLYTTTSDLARLIQSHLPGPRGELSGRGVVTPETLELMREPHARVMGADIWGLGTILYAPTREGGYVIGHDGNNDPAINTAARLNPDTGDGIVVLETGNSFLATRLAGEWVYWQTGKADFLIFMIGLERTIRVIMIGALVILVLVPGLVFVRRRRAV